MLLAIDAGNTRVKWGLFDAHGKMQLNGACFHAELDKTLLPSCENVIISNVAGDAIAQQLKSKLLANASIKWVQSSTRAFNINNGYDDPATLGTDRWAAIVGAWQQHQTSCIVVNAGTCVTVDTIKANAQGATFIGGMILPGLYLMQQQLHDHTAQLSDYRDEISQQRYNAFLGSNTRDAIQIGAISAITGAIKLACDALKAKTQQPPLIMLSGGDASVIASYYQQTINTDKIPTAISILDNLVLLGLFSLYNDAQSNKTNKHLKQSETL